MRFMMIVKSNADSEAGKMPSEAELAAMGKYNEELVRAGVMLDVAGLYPSVRGARVKFNGKRTTVFDGPFSETKELIAGYWIIEAKSLAEAVEWARRVPNIDGAEAEIEVRQVGEAEDLAPSEAVDKMIAPGERGGLVPKQKH